MTARHLFAQQQANRRRSALLVAGFVMLFAWVGFGGDLAGYLYTRDLPPESYHHNVPFVGLLALTAAGAITWRAWRHGPRRVLWATGAWQLVEAATPEQRRLVNVVEEMCAASGLPRPSIWIVPDPDPNAFATGIDPSQSHIAVTEGLLNVLNRDELQGVVAHEMSHIQNYDVRLMTLLAAMVGSIALLSDGLGRFLRFGSWHGGRRSGGGKKGGNPLALIVLVAWLLTVIIAPVVSRLMAMSVSRKREYLADATAAQFTRNPAGLASALEKLDNSSGATRSIARGAAHLCIVDPAERRISGRDGAVADLFASHPPMRHRISRLRGMAFQQQKREADAVTPSA